MTKVSIVILNWNGKRDTLECLKSIDKVSVVGFELSVYVVDNGSTDDSVRKINKSIKSSTNIKNVKKEIIKVKENLGFSGGNNIGINKAIQDGADYILTLNNDTLVHKGLVVELLKSAKKQPKAGVISPKIYFAKGFEFHKSRYKSSDLGKVIWAAGGDMDWDNVYGVNHGVDEVDVGQFEKERQIDFATGAAMFLRVKALKEVGVFDEKLYLYMEDLDLCIRMRKAGWEVMYSPRSVVWHKVSQSSGIGSDLNDYFITRNRMVLGMRYGNLRTRFALGRESLKLLISGRKWQKKGIIDAYKGKYGKGSWSNGK